MRKLFLIFTMLFTGILVSACTDTSVDEDNTYTVTFYTDGGEEISSVEVEENTKVRRPTDPIKTDYRFTEWQLNNQTYDFDSLVTSDITLKATYKYTGVGTEDGASTYTVTFVTNGGTSVASQTVDKDSLLSTIETTKEGYNFYGWLIAGTTTYFDVETSVVTSNLTLEAVWELIPSIDIDELDIFISEVYESNNTSTDRYIELFNPTTSDISLTDYTLKFAYNNTTLEATTHSIDLTGQTIKSKSCLVIFFTSASDAVKANSVTSNVMLHSKVLHDADDRYGLYNPAAQLIDTVEQVSSNHNAKDSRMTRNYGASGNSVFDYSEWTILAASDSSSLDDCGIHKLFETDIDQTIYTVSFNTDGGSSIPVIRILSGEYISVSDPSKTGYEFAGWSSNSQPYDITKPITSNLTITAIWDVIGLDDVELDIFFSEIYESDASNNDRYIEIYNPTEYEIALDDYVIVMAYNNNAPTLTSSARTITLEGYTLAPYSTIVIYDAAMSKTLVEQINGVKFSHSNILHDGNDNYGLYKNGVLIDMLGELTTTNYHSNTSLRRNFEMYGSTVFNLNEWTSYTANVDSGITDAGSHTFRELPTYTVTFDTDGGTSVETITVVTGQMLVLPTAPTKSGYKFVCWMNGDEIFDTTTLIKSNYTLTAVWEEFNGNMYTVTFDTGNSLDIINPQIVYEGNKVICPYPPFYEGYNLVAWATEDENGFDFNTIITSDIKLIAVWEVKVFYTVTFNANGGTEVDSIIVEDGYTIDFQTTTKFGYSFNDWRLNGESIFNFDTPITSDITLEATWTAIVYTPETINVSTVSELSSAINKAEPGDTIVMKDGTYEMTSSMTMNNSGTDFGLITIQAETSGGVVFTNQANIIIKGDYVVFSGFSFKDGTAKSGGYVIEVHGSHCRITNVEIDGYDTATNKSGYITVKDSAKYTEIDNCSFLNKNSPGVLLLIDKYSDDAMYAHVHHNYFYNYTNPDPVTWTNELETMRIGWSGHSQSACYSVVEYNIFESISSETELISVKSGYNVVRNNYILNCSAAITIRHGNTCLVENNVIMNDGIEDGNGIRVFDAYHVIRNNYISGSNDQDSSFFAALVLHNGGNKEGTINGSTNGQWTTNNVLVEGNTFVNNEVNIAIGDKNYSNVPWDITFKNNFVYSDGYAAIRMYDNVPKVTFEGEYYYANSLGMTTTPSGINYFVDLTQATISVVNTLTYHATAGAQGLSVMAYEEVGVKSSMTQSVNMDKDDYTAYFANWPYDLV